VNAKDTYKVECVNMRRGFGVHNYDYHEYFYRWYWQADLRSWIEHNVWGFDCATFVKNEAIESGKVKPRPVVWK
jgi:hypothetical protein